MDYFSSERPPSYAPPPSLCGSLAHYNPLSPVAEEAVFRFDESTTDRQLDRALTAIVSDDINTLLCCISSGIDVTKTYRVVSCGITSSYAQGPAPSTAPPQAPPAKKRWSSLAEPSGGDCPPAGYYSLSQVLGVDCVVSAQLRNGPVIGPTVQATLLHVAAVHNAFTCAKFLVHLGAPLEGHESYRRDTALHLAVRRGAVPLAEHLLEEGADIQATNARGDSPLHVAAALGRLHLTRLFIEQGANLLAKNRYGETAWERAVTAGNPSAKACGDLLVCKHFHLKEMAIH